MPPKIALTVDVQTPRTHTVEGSVVKIGTISSCHLRLEDPAASRMHAVIEVSSPTEMTIIDLGSDNGTYVNGARVNKSPLQIGDRITIGSTTIVVKIAEPILKEPAGYRESPIVANEDGASIALSTEANIVVLKTSPWSIAARWWPAPASAAMAVWYLSQHGLTLPDWDLERLEFDWPVSPLLLFTGLVALLFALGDAFLRREDKKRTPVGRLLLVLGAVTGAPLLFQLGFGAVTIGSAVFGIVMVAGIAIYAIYAVGRWILRGRE